MTGRLSRFVPKLHASAWGAAICAATVVALANLPARIVVAPDLFSPGKYGPHFQCSQHFEHGWPLTFSWRESRRWVFGIGFQSTSLWRISDGLTRFSIAALVIDLATGAVLVPLAAIGFESWRRRRRSLFQWKLKEALAVVAGICVACGWLAALRSQYESELRCLELIDQEQSEQIALGSARAKDWAESQKGGPWWLRRLCGERFFQQFDRVVRMDFEPSHLRYARQISQLRAVGLRGGYSTEELATLKELPCLQAVDVANCFSTDELDLESGGEEHSTDPLLEILSTIPHLEGINLYEAGVSANGLKNLRSLRRLKTLDLTGSGATDEGLSALENMTELRSLSLASTKLTDKGMRHFARLSRLEWLWLDGTEITDAGLALLPPQPQLHELSLSGTNITAKCLPVLKRQHALEYLNLMDTSISAADVRELQQALPKCQIFR